MSPKRIKRIITPNKDNDCYQYQWYSEDCSENFYAIGILGQQLFVNPKTKMILVRLGKSTKNYGGFIDAINNVVEGKI